jgi:hypothetical protein
VTRCYRYDLEWDETLRRHRTKPNATVVTEDAVRSWYRSSDPVPDLAETGFDATISLRAALETVLSEVGWVELADRADLHHADEPASS